MGTKNFNSATDLITFTRASSSTFIGSNGLIQTATNNVPRIEYDADGTVKGLLIEEARTNLLPISNAFNTWTRLKTSVTTSTEISPSGSADAFIVKPNVSSGATTWVYYNPYINTGLVTTISTFAKASGKSFLTMSNTNGTNRYASFNLTTGAVGTVASGYTANVEDFDNGWYRCSVTTPTGFNERAIFAVSDTDGGISSVVNGDDGILLYGAQVEAGEFPTSYIPTTGATATRAADTATILIDDFGYNHKEGTVVMEANTISTIPTNHDDLRIVDELGFNMMHSGSRIGGYASGSYVVYSSVTNVNMKVDSVISDGQMYKAAFVMKENNATLSVDGSAVVTDTTTNFSSKTAYMFKLGHGHKHLNGHIKSMKYYPRGLTDTQLQELTT